MIRQLLPLVVCFLAAVGAVPPRHYGSPFYSGQRPLYARSHRPREGGIFSALHDAGLSRNTLNSALAAVSAVAQSAAAGASSSTQGARSTLSDLVNPETLRAAANTVAQVAAQRGPSRESAERLGSSLRKMATPEMLQAALQQATAAANAFAQHAAASTADARSAASGVRDDVFDAARDFEQKASEKADIAAEAARAIQAQAARAIQAQAFEKAESLAATGRECGSMAASRASQVAQGFASTSKEYGNAAASNMRDAWRHPGTTAADLMANRKVHAQKLVPSFDEGQLSPAMRQVAADLAHLFQRGKLPLDKVASTAASAASTLLAAAPLSMREILQSIQPSVLALKTDLTPEEKEKVDQLLRVFFKSQQNPILHTLPLLENLGKFLRDEKHWDIAKILELMPHLENYRRDIPKTARIPRYPKKEKVE